MVLKSNTGVTVKIYLSDILHQWGKNLLAIIYPRYKIH